MPIRNEYPSDVSTQLVPHMSSDELDELHHEILDILADGRATPALLAERTGESRQLISNRLRDLRLTGDVQRVHKGLYELTHETSEDVPPHELREADDDLLELVGSDAVEWDDMSKTDDRVRACALLLTRIRRGARYTNQEIKDSPDELGVSLGGATWIKGVNEAVDAADDINRTNTTVYWSPR